MLLILSSDTDTSTNHVIDWLIYYGVNFIRINRQDSFRLNEFEISNKNIICKLQNVTTNEIIDITKISAIWYRRGNFVFLDDCNLNFDFAGILSYSKKAYQIVHDFIMHYLELLPRLDSYFRSSMNKLQVLSIARSVGLKIPNTRLFQGDFPMTLSGDYITKSIFELFKYKLDEITYYTPTTLLDADKIKEKDLTYGLSQVQDHIKKECDIRVFYLRGKFFSMAIMSQQNEKSMIDFRHYPSDHPNRNFPIKLPKKTKEKLNNLMTKVQLDSGSIDLILNRDGQFVFLEVNPVGQFGMTSAPCNYLLEREIAQDLSDITKKK